MNYSLIGFVESNLLLLFAAGIFMFFAVPLMNPPFIFVLYAGAVVVSLACGVFMPRSDAFARPGRRTRAEACIVPVIDFVVRGQSCRCVSWHNPAKPVLDGVERASASASNTEKV
jgi:NADH:ubiquinone oxidoreductase subunit 6 (subunit J)